MLTNGLLIADIRYVFRKDTGFIRVVQHRCEFGWREKRYLSCRFETLEAALTRSAYFAHTLLGDAEPLLDPADSSCKRQVDLLLTVSRAFLFISAFQIIDYLKWSENMKNGYYMTYFHNAKNMHLLK